jgi:hypothetical protein
MILFFKATALSWKQSPTKKSGVPDAIFSNQKSKSGTFWSVLQWSLLAYFTANRFVLHQSGKLEWSFGTFYYHLVHFAPFWCIISRKIWQPCKKVLLVAKTSG